MDTTGSDAEAARQFKAQVVGVQWLSPLQRRDYSTEWQLLWTLGLARPNVNDDQVRGNPKKYTTLQVIGSIAFGDDGKETFSAYHAGYIDELIVPFHDIYFSSSRYFYNAHSLKDRTTWRELAGIHIEYALPAQNLDPVEAANYTRDRIISTFSIGNKNFPTAWSRATPPEVRVTTGGANAGFTSLSAALDYLKAHPDKTVWAMNWDAPSRPKDEQLNENMVLLVLAGPTFKTDRDPLAWIAYPASHHTEGLERKPGPPAQVGHVWQATIAKAIDNASKRAADIGYVIHDANYLTAGSPERIVNLANAVSHEVAGFDFVGKSFNTPALLGEMGAGTALTNVALGIAYANHIGANVLVAGTSDPARPTAVVVIPPAKARPIDHDKPWFRARSENTAHLMWWGLRHDHGPYTQGYSR
ncbi:hypothetical protein GCM10007387_36060 [Pseudoduganella albidiflava]|uniref:Virulence factor n=1 Tax=Pseudoduganella albidiflava TaxID=321983 RepID=A0AA88C1Z0_9BURK|nr:hypothetical protein GCM10007387_36060 [Pseudoduganella albidiflava]